KRIEKELNDFQRFYANDAGRTATSNERWTIKKALLIIGRAFLFMTHLLLKYHDLFESLHPALVNNTHRRYSFLRRPAYIHPRFVLCLYSRRTTFSYRQNPYWWTYYSLTLLLVI